MIIKILILVFSLILISLILVFLSIFFSPAIKKQTGIDSDFIFNEIEHNFKKLNEKETINEISKRALVMCSCNKKFDLQLEMKPAQYQSCSVLASAYSSLNYCKYSCLGLGDCVKKCSQEAIYIVNGTAKINNLCTGCGECLSSCPKSLIKLVPADLKNVVVCNNTDQKLTTCSNFQKMENIEYPEKKGFKIWKSCYKLLHK